MLFNLVSLGLAAAASLAPSALAVPSPSPASNNGASLEERTLFCWRAPNGQCISWWSLAGKPNAGSPPAGKTCPQAPITGIFGGEWYWNTALQSCAPTKIEIIINPTCPNGWIWGGFVSPADWTCSSSSGVPAYNAGSSDDCDSSSQFWWNDKSYCCTNGGTSTLTSPSDRSCPTGWSWGGSFCIPSTEDLASQTQPTCTVSGHNWISGSKYCAPSTTTGTSSSQCDLTWQFFWLGGQTCCQKSPATNIGTAPSGKSCPSSGWFWHSLLNYCIPKTESDCAAPTPSCTIPVGLGPLTWDASSKYCHGHETPASSGSECSGAQFWWPLSKVCVTSDASTGESCPSTRTCPNNYQWIGGSSGHCVPKDSGACTSPGPCPNAGTVWGPNERYCVPGASAKPRRQVRSNKPALPLGQVDEARCPGGLTACPVPGSLNKADYECLSPLTELASCGGCVSLNQGQDCTAIQGARLVGCEVGTCAVYSCASGYTISSDRKTCVKDETPLFVAQERKTRR